MTEPFKFANGQIAYNVTDLVNICRNFPDDSLEYLNRGDFEGWLEYIGQSSLAQEALTIRESDLANQERLDKFITTCQAVELPAPTKPTNTSQPISPERVERRFRIIYLPGVTKTRQARSGETQQVVSYTMLSNRLQSINRSGGKIIDIQPV